MICQPGQEDHDNGGEEGEEGKEGDEELTNVTLARGTPTKLLSFSFNLAKLADVLRWQEYHQLIF